MDEPFDPYSHWLAIPPHEQPPNHYRLLGVQLFEDNAAVIENSADRQIAHLRSFQLGVHSRESQAMLDEVAAARACLLDPLRKREYDRELRSQHQRPEAFPPPPTLIPSERQAVPPLAPAPLIQAVSSATIPSIDAAPSLDKSPLRVQKSKRRNKSIPPGLMAAMVIAASIVPLLFVLLLFVLLLFVLPVEPSTSTKNVSQGRTIVNVEKAVDQTTPAIETVDSGTNDKGRGDEKPRNSFTKSLGMKLTLIPAGEFRMGSPASEKDRCDDEQQHRVRISQAFYLGTTEVTQSQWQAVMGTRPWAGKKYVKEGRDYPATYVSWEDAVEFCRRLSAREGRVPRCQQTLLAFVCAYL